MPARHKALRFTALLVLALCLVAVAVASFTAPAAGTAGPSISGLLPAQAPASSQLSRTARAHHARPAGGAPLWVVPRPSLALRPAWEAGPALAFSPVRGSSFAGVHAGRAPPSFS